MKVFDMDNKGVSPVVGTILLIAITVVLAGTIGYFATQQSPGDAAPSVSLSVENNEIVHNGGETVDIIIEDPDATDADNPIGNGTLSVGGSVSFSPSGATEIVVIHEGTDSVLLREELD